MRTAPEQIIQTLGVPATLRRRERGAVDSVGRETSGTLLEAREVRAIVDSSRFFEDAQPGGETRSKTSAHLIPSDWKGDAAEEDVTLEVGDRIWKVVEAEPERGGVQKLWLEIDE